MDGCTAHSHLCPQGEHVLLAHLLPEQALPLGLVTQRTASEIWSKGVSLPDSGAHSATQPQQANCQRAAL